MDGVELRISRRKSFKDRLGLIKSMGCCGSTWGLTRDDNHDCEAEDPHPTLATTDQSGGSGMNLAAALAAERLFRSTQEMIDGSSAVQHTSTPVGTAPGTPSRVSLMRLLEESDGGDGELEKENKKSGVGSDCVCCVCMGRKKGSAFIPCGHTFCRVCSRELWLNRGSCPLCNRSILEILDIF